MGQRGLDRGLVDGRPRSGGLFPRGRPTDRRLLLFALFGREILGVKQFWPPRNIP